MLNIDPSFKRINTLKGISFSFPRCSLFYFIERKTCQCARYIVENTLAHVCFCCAVCTHHSNSTHDGYYFNLTCDGWTTEEHHLNENVTNINVCRKAVCYCGNSTHSKKAQEGELGAATKMNEYKWKYPGYIAVKFVRSKWIFRID